jgi:hypothetical protein
MLLCHIGVHRWRRRLTARPGTTVYRCDSCDACVVKHRGARRIAKRFYFLGAVTCSLMLWFVSVNVATTGHTKVLKTTRRAVHKADRTGIEIRGAIHKAEGDRGQHVE